MKNINVLILNDRSRARKIVRYAVEQFNSGNYDIRLCIAGEVESVDDAESIIRSTPESMQLVFLDYELKGNKKGFELCRNHPDLDCIVMSCHPKIFQFIAEEKRTNRNGYMEHITEGQNYNIDLIVLSIQKYLTYLKSN